ncbi:MAG: hypothetical protein PHR24_04395 [Oscillospiraceae bacterium]|nr:hypothetical protein [Oscillospiraceae bacterium]MDD3833527.1 hypothetical protein [Oscillospiraceae bacterium]MDD4546515.1 hypothetical protein [Oscillospiraceae bacterium]
MKRKDIKRAFDKVEPDERKKELMLENILNHKHSGSDRKSLFATPFFKLAVPLAAALVLVIGGVLVYNNMPQKELPLKSPYGKEGSSDVGGVITDDIAGREDMVAEIRDQFRMENKHYMVMSDEMKAEFGFGALGTSDIGEKISTITNSVDAGLIGCEVYRYIPADCQAVVAVKKDDGYRLFKFFNYESYNNNQDEDADAYLKLYGIKGAADISKIQFLTTSDQPLKPYGLTGEITELSDKKTFYDYYSVIKNSSDQYFEKLFSYRKEITEQTVEGGSVMPSPEDAPDRPTADYGADEYNPGVGQVDIAYDLPRIGQDDVGVAYDTAGNAGSSVAGNTGSARNALSDSVILRIYNNSGVYFEAPYYKNIGFISRHQVGPDFAEFLKGFIN